MAKKIVTIKKLDEMAAADGFGNGTVKQRFYNNYGSAYTENRCPTKDEIVLACSGMINHIRYYPAGSSPVKTNFLVPEDEITFDGYDTHEVNVTINNIGDKHNIYNGAFDINVFYDDKNGHIINIGGGRFPNDDYEILPGRTWESGEYPFITKIRRSALTANGRVGFTISYDGYYSQFANESWFDVIDDDTEKTGIHFTDTNSDKLIDYRDGSTRHTGLYYPLHNITINSALSASTIIIDPSTYDTITMSIDIHNHTTDYIGNAEVKIHLYDANGNQVAYTTAPAVTAGESATKNITFDIERNKNIPGCSIEFVWNETYNLSCDFVGVHVEGESPLRINNVSFRTYDTIEIYR